MAKTIKLINESDYEVYVLPEARAKMEMYCELCEKEIGWLGFVEKLPGIGFMITDVVLLKQEVNGATTEIDPAALLDLWGQTAPENQSKIKVWGHSHVNMAPNPSAQDDSQMKYFADGNDWFIRLITNKKGDMNITIYDYVNGFEVHNDKLITYNPHRAEMRKEIEAEIKEKVKEKTYTAPPASKNYSNTYNRFSQAGSRYSNSVQKHKASTVEPMFKDIEIKYVKTFDDVLNDPNYWQSTIV